MSRDFLNIGSTPADEACQGVGTDSYNHERAMKECNTFLKQIRRELGPEPDGARLAVKGFPHDFGTYHEVVCHFNTDQPESVEYAYKCEAESPQNWDEQSRMELEL